MCSTGDHMIGDWETPLGIPSCLNMLCDSKECLLHVDVYLTTYGWKMVNYELVKSSCEVARFKVRKKQIRYKWCEWGTLVLRIQVKVPLLACTCGTYNITKRTFPFFCSCLCPVTLSMFAKEKSESCSKFIHFRLCWYPWQTGERRVSCLHHHLLWSRVSLSQLCVALS